MRTYNSLFRLKTFKERYDYLRLVGTVGASTFGFDRYINQMLYRSREWLSARDTVIIRDDGCDLGIDGYKIYGKIIVHHMNPLSIKDIEDRNPNVFNPDFLVCVSHKTHQAIHYGDESLLPKDPVIRRPGDTTLWR